MSVFDYAIVGAGLAGLSAARKLAQAGRSVLVLEKGRGAGGRLATRRGEHGRFDLGAQYFTVRDPRFASAVETWFAAGHVAPWPGRIRVWRDGVLSNTQDDPVRYVGVPGMSALARALCAGLDVRFESRVAAIAFESDLWRLRGERDDAGWQAENLVLALPPAQAAALLASYPAIANRLAAVNFAPCWALMLSLRDPLDFPADGVFVHDSPLSWLARDSSKPGREGETWVVHANPAWSRANLEKVPEMIVPELGAAFARVVNDVVRPRYADAHRWRYALPDPALPEPCLHYPELKLGLAGDWCGGPRVEGAYLSGLSLAERMLANGPSRR